MPFWLLVISICTCLASFRMQTPCCCPRVDRNSRWFIIWHPMHRKSVSCCDWQSKSGSADKLIYQVWLLGPQFYKSASSSESGRRFFGTRKRPRLSSHQSRHDVAGAFALTLACKCARQNQDKIWKRYKSGVIVQRSSSFWAVHL